MRYTVVLITFVLLVAGCRHKVEVYPTTTFDTLGVTWMVIERKNMTYYFQGTGVKGASIYTDQHEQAYDKLAAIFNPVLPGKLRYFVWTDWTNARPIFSAPEWSGGLAFSRHCACHVQADIPLGHEIVHVMTYWANGTEPNSYARFINEGVAEAFDLQDDDKIQAAKDAVKAFPIGSITELWVDTTESAPPDLIYPVGGAFMQYMHFNSTWDEYSALLKNQALPDAELIYGKERLRSHIAEFDRILGL